jgi:Asp-tRNA(Asn)/Glu-tRNA(Gln) amidotransferase A subunit family amidase
MARTAEDVRLLFSVLAGYDPADPFSAPVPLQPVEDGRVRRIGVWEQFSDVPVDGEIRHAVRRAAAFFQPPRFAVEEFSPLGLERAPNVWAFLFSTWPSVALRKLLEGCEEQVHWTLTETLAAASAAEPPTAERVLRELAARDRMRASLMEQMAGLDAVIMPVCGIKAFRHHERRWDVERRSLGLFQAMMPAVIANVMGLPAVTIPFAISASGLPIGIQLLGRPYEDELLLDLAVLLEQWRGPLADAVLAGPGSE